jgi:hypothetical protein
VVVVVVALRLRLPLTAVAVPPIPHKLHAAYVKAGAGLWQLYCQLCCQHLHAEALSVRAA